MLFIFLFQSFRNIETILSLQVAHTQVVAWFWPMGCTVPTPGRQSSWGV